MCWSESQLRHRKEKGGIRNLELLPFGGNKYAEFNNVPEEMHVCCHVAVGSAKLVCRLVGTEIFFIKPQNNFSLSLFFFYFFFN